MATAANWTRENLAWAAGLFEGEGSIYPPQNRISLTSTDRDVLDKFLSIVGVGTIRERTHMGCLGKKKQWNWVCNKQEHTQAILAAFWHWLGSRRRTKAEQFFARMAKPAQIMRGARNGMAKITEDQAIEIFNSKEKPSELARRYGLTITSVCYLKEKKTWKHIHGTC